MSESDPFPPAPALPWTERLRPRHLDEVVGNEGARRELREWASGWIASDAPPARRAAVLSGPPGVGKTSSAHALAEDFSWALVELNASDARNAAAIDDVAGRASRSRSFGRDGSMGAGSRTLILLDEADCLTGRASGDARPTASPVAWPEFLRGRYGSVEALNRAWELESEGAPVPPFARWEDLPRQPIRQRWTQIPAAARDIADWRGTARPLDLSDRGGLGAIAKLVQETHQPVILTVNSEEPLVRYSSVFRTGVTRIRFDPLSDAEIRSGILRVARREHLPLEAGAVTAIAARAHGDFRAALNDLEAIAPLPPGPAQVTALGPRDRTADLAALLADALASPRFYRAVEVQDRTDAAPDDVVPWVEENLPRAAPDLRRGRAAFDRLAAADVLLGRARRFRTYVLWSYASELMVGGVSLALRDRPGRAVAIAFPSFLGGMGRSRQARALREAVLRRLAPPGHLSREKLREGALDFFEISFHHAVERPGDRSWRNLARTIVSAAEIPPEEVAYLAGVPPDSEEVARLFEPLERSDRAPPEPPREGPARRTAGQRRLGDFA
ncbi:MAG: AAA family ATPase [Thermoplasmata archaeon]